MTAFIDATRDQGVRNAPRSLSWTEMATGVWVGRVESDFAGLIEKLWGAGFRVTDHRGNVVGEFATFESARDKLKA